MSKDSKLVGKNGGVRLEKGSDLDPMPKMDTNGRCTISDEDEQGSYEVMIPLES